MNPFKARAGTRNDIDAIIAIEKQAFKDSGAPTFGRKEIESWFDVHPEGVLLAEKDGRVVAFTYMQLIHLDPENLPPFKTHDELSDNSSSRATHTPDGNCFHGFTLDSISPGAGLFLLEKAKEFVKQKGKPYLFGTSRIVGFNNVMRAVALMNPEITLTKELEQSIAVWYARKTAAMVNGWIGKLIPDTPNTADLVLPELDSPDPILGFYLMNECEMHSFLPDFIHDPPSRGHAFLCLWHI